MNHTTQKLTQEQAEIVRELCETHGLDPSQISFEEKQTTPIFDYEAVCALSLKLTDIKTIDCEIKPRTDAQALVSIAVCTVILPDGRSRTVEDSAEIGESVAGNQIITRREAEGIAQNRAVRRGIRSVGVNLYNAHRTFMKTGEIEQGTTDADPREAVRREIHALADELGYTRDDYEELIAAGYSGRRSTVDLNDLERQAFARLLRSLRRIQLSRQAYAADVKQAA